MFNLITDSIDCAYALQNPFAKSSGIILGYQMETGRESGAFSPGG